MLPAILLGSEDNSVSNETEGFVFSEVRKRTHEFFRAMPYSARFTGCSIGDINGPGVGPSLKQGQTLFEAVVADERDLLAVRRPPRHGVAIHRRSKVADGFAAEIVDADEAVVPAMGNEGDLRTIGRPLGRIILPAHEGKLMRRHRAGHRRSPELPARGPNRRSEEHTSELQSHSDLVCRLLLEK